MPIIIEVHKPNRLTDNLIGHVRLTEEAEVVLRELYRQTGLPMRQLASTIITQAADQIEIKDIP